MFFSKLSLILHSPALGLVNRLFIYVCLFAGILLPMFGELKVFICSIAVFCVSIPMAAVRVLVPCRQSLLPIPTAD